MTFGGFESNSRCWQQPYKKKGTVGGLVSGFTNANHTSWFNFKPFHLTATTFSKVTSQIQNPFCCVPGPPDCGTNQPCLNLRPRKPSASSGRYPLFVPFLVSHLHLLSSHPSHLSRMALRGSSLLSLNISMFVSFFMTWMMFYLWFQ